jgi:hypothetical protein
MPVNFSNLVLRPCEATFAIEITVDPVASRPGGVPYDTRGIYTSRTLDVQFDGWPSPRHRTSE